MSKLTPKQEKFCREYVKDMNASAAARRAGYSVKNSDNIASELMGKTWVAERVQELTTKQIQKAEITAEEVIREFRAIALVDIKDLYNDDGSPKAISDIPEHARKAIASVETYKDFTEGVEIGETKKLKLWDKTKALDMLAKYLKLIAPDGGTTNNTQVNVQVNVNAETARMLDKYEDDRWED